SINNVDYFDYSEWYNNNFKEVRDSQLRDWTYNLQNLHFESNVNTVVKNTVGIEKIDINNTLYQSLSDYSKRRNVSVYVLLLAAYFRATESLNHKKQLIVGIPVSGRNYEGTQNIIGLFRNFLPISVNTSGCTDNKLINIIQKQVLSALDKQDVQTYEIEENWVLRIYLKMHLSIKMLLIQVCSI
ncbi:condensation domain-containing protein, partial [Bombilactobacillus bombi]|uniref:condensation domain-containing protein n=1 Tax=Bombilactobacillus bombi TaxID=1303590 RepID=UPI002159E445